MPPLSERSDQHFDRLARLLELESRAEAEATAAKRRRGSAAGAEAGGACLLDLTLRDERSGLGGRRILELGKSRPGTPLPWTRLDAGSPVVLSVDGGSQDLAEGVRFARRGVVAERDERWIRVAIDDVASELDAEATWRIDLAHDEAALDRQREALARARSVKAGRLAELRAILLGERPALFSGEGEGEGAGTSEGTAAGAPLHPFGPLDGFQAAAVRHALAARDVALIHGPPGTGKTTTLVEIIRQALLRKEKVLATAPSNLAVDNILERLVRAGVRAVRLGHPARVLPELVAYALDEQVERHEGVRLARKLVQEAWALRRKAGKFTRARPEPGAKSEMYREARALVEDARRIEAQAVERILDGAEVILSTTSIDADVLRDRVFDLVIIDEACQSTEPGCWVPIGRARRLVLAGDHLQLPPTVLSEEAAADGFAVSLFERLIDLDGARLARRLDVQYRMHRDIMTFSSRELYGGSLIADPSVAGHRLSDLPGVRAEPLTERPMELIDTAGAGYDEAVEPDGESRLNRDEAALVVRKVEALLAAGVAPAEVAVIAPYAAQARLVRELLGAQAVGGVEVDTVDGFQGREKEAIVISLVRSNPDQEIGFLKEIRRTNVALTRARRKLIVIGDGATVAGHDFYARLLGYADEIGAHRSVWEE